MSDQVPELPPVDPVVLERAARINSEQTKLFATWLNTIAAHIIALGIVGPLVSCLSGTMIGTVSPEGAMPLAVTWIVVGTLLHFVTRFVLTALP